MFKSVGDLMDNVLNIQLPLKQTLEKKNINKSLKLPTGHVML